jgi:hypothetical protein
MTDSSGSSGMGFSAGVDSTQGDIARANQSQRQGNGKLLGPRSERDVSRPMACTYLPASSTKDQATMKPPR